MSFKKIVRNYNSISIPIEVFEKLRKDYDNRITFEIVYSDVTPLSLIKIPKSTDLENKLSNTILKSNFNNYIDSLLIKKNGIFIDTKKIISKLCEIYGIDKNNIWEEFNHLLPLRKDELELKASKYLESYKNYYENYKNKRITKINLLKNYHREIKSFYEIVKNKNQYRIDVDDSIIDQNKASIYVANMILKTAKENENEKNNQYLEAMKYLKDFCNDNIDSEYVYIGKEMYSPISIKLYVNKSNTNQTVEKYNYNFFETNKENLKVEVNHYIERTGITRENKELLDRKIEFYNKLKINKIKIGKDSFEGFIGFELNDDYTIIDRFFRGKKIANEGALFIVKTSDFEKITKMNGRKELGEAILDNKIKAKKINHNFSFEGRTEDYIIDLLKNHTL